MFVSFAKNIEKSMSVRSKWDHTTVGGNEVLISELKSLSDDYLSDDHLKSTREAGLGVIFETKKCSCQHAHGRSHSS